MTMRSFLSMVPAVLTNKFLLAVLALSIWMLFFDRNDIMSQFARHQKLKELKANAAYFDQKIADAKAELERRKSDPTAYERIAREKYYMKKDNEDIFVFDK